MNIRKGLWSFRIQNVLHNCHIVYKGILFVIKNHNISRKDRYPRMIAAGGGGGLTKSGKYLIL